MGATLDNNALKRIRITGRGLTTDLVEACSSVRLSSSSSAVTEMTLKFADSHTLGTFRSGVLSRGSSISYGQWNTVVEDVLVRSGPIGPELEVVAPSRTVTRLRGQTGARSWGTQDAAAWARGVISGVGGKPIVQPGLGSATLFRNPPDEDGGVDSTWDVLTDLAREKGVWLFERGPWVVFARPSWLMANPWSRRTWPLVWNSWSDYSPALMGMPAYSNRASTSPAESLTIRLVSRDADTAQPGDEVSLRGSGVGAMGGRWIITSVDLPFTVGSPVVASCERPVDPKVQPPRSRPADEASPVAGRTRTKTSASTGGAAPSGLAAAVDRWVASVNGRYLDYDGAFGSQCVDLVLYYNRDVVGGGAISGNGNQWFNHPNTAGAYTRYAVGGANGESARKGDIACWGAFYGGGYGHVAIVLEDLGGQLLCLSQNPGPARRQTLSKQGLQGYLRPRRYR